MKIDIEGHELHALEPFFDTAPVRQWPRKILIEVGHDLKSEALDLCLARGYRIEKEFAINLYLSLKEPVDGA